MFYDEYDEKQNEERQIFRGKTSMASIIVHVTKRALLMMGNNL